MKKCVMFLFFRKRKNKFDSLSSKRSRLSVKTSRNMFHLEKKDILYDIDEKEENELSADDSKPNTTTTNKVKCL
jgi:hypothetical protein